MKTPQKITALLGRVWHHTKPRRRHQFVLLFLLTSLGSIAEIVSIGAVLPFLSVLAAPDGVFNHPLAQPFIRATGIATPDQLLLPVTIAFCLSALLVGVTRLLLLWANTRLSLAAGADLSIEIYRRTLYQPYAVHIARNSAEIINAISVKTAIVTSSISAVIQLISCSIVLVAVLLALLSIDPVVALAAFGGFGSIYAIVIHVTRKRVMVNSQVLARESTKVIKSLQEGLGGIRDVLIDGSQEPYCDVYLHAQRLTNRAQASSTFITLCPRYVLEPLGMTLIAFLAYFMVHRSDGIAGAIPVLGALAMGAQRLLPVLQQAYAAWTGIRGSQASLQDALELLDQPLPEYAGQPVPERMAYSNHFGLKQLSFRYTPDTPWVLRNLDLRIPRGSRVGFIGVTGSGKSTLLDIIMGLLQPTSGELLVDETPITLANHRAWQAHIAHVPQAIFLSDSSIEENIAFGVPEEHIDHQRVRTAARQAQIADTIEAWPKQYRTLVGERGIRLSGGQRQRIGIARSLYKKADVIVFDEATSALDNETEHAVMEAVDGLSHDLTILIIAHRLTTLKNCSLIIELGGGGVLRTGSYQEIVANHQ